MTNARAKKLAVDEAKKLVKLMAGNKCEKCGKGGVMHGAHIMPVTFNGTAADPENILCLCPACHSMGPNSAHQQPHLFVYWLDDKFPGRYQMLRDRAKEYSRNPSPKKDWEQIRKELKILIDLYQIKE